MYSLQELAQLAGARLKGADITISGVASLSRAKKGDLVFVDNPKHFQTALASEASAIVGPESLAEHESPKSFILAAKPKLAFARLVSVIVGHNRPAAGVDETAILGNNITLGKDVHIGAYVVIGDNVTIGDGSAVMAGSIVGNYVRIGQDCTLYPNVTLYDRVSLGDRVIIHSGTVVGADGFGYIFDEGTYHKFPQIGDVVIEDDVEIGSNSCIDRGALESTVIERGTKIDNLVQVAHNVRIGRSVVLAAQVGISGSSQVEEYVVLGGQVGIADHVRIERGAVVGAQAGVPTGKIIRAGQIVWGTPARPIREFKEVYAQTQQLPALKRRISELEKRLEELERTINRS